MTTAPLPTPGEPVAPPPSGRGPRAVVILAIVVGVLLLALVAVVGLLIGRGTATPDAGNGRTPTPTPASSESGSPTPTPSAEDTQAPPPVDTSTRFLSFDADLAVECDPTGEQPKPEITFSWRAANAVEAWYSPSDEDAKDDGYLRFPNANAGTQSDLTDEHLFPCNHEQFLDVTITLVGPGGEHVSRTVRYEDVNWGS